VVAVAVVMSRRARAQVAALCVAAVACVVAILPMVTRDPSAFTDRGYIWNISLEAWHASPWVGHGANWYEQIASTAANVGSTVFHGHNQFVQLLVTGGLVLVCLVVWQYVLVARRAARISGRTGVLATTYLAALLGTCMLEVSLAYVDNFSMLFVAAVPTAVLMFSEPTAISTTVASPLGRAAAEPALVVSGGAGDG
jgi:O-antigen ligase